MSYKALSWVTQRINRIQSTTQTQYDRYITYIRPDGMYFCPYN